MCGTGGTVPVLLSGNLPGKGKDADGMPALQEPLGGRKAAKWVVTD
jgi:hypothetical protein